MPPTGAGTADASGGHETWHGLRLLLPLGIDVDREFRTRKSLIAPQPDNAVQGILDTLGQNAHPSPPRIPRQRRKCPADHFAQLATRLADAGHRSASPGRNPKGRFAPPFLPDHPRITELSGQLDLMQLMALQSHAALVVASSTGPFAPAASTWHTGPRTIWFRSPCMARSLGPPRPSCQPLRDRGPPRDGTLDLSVTDVMEAGLRRSTSPVGPDEGGKREDHRAKVTPAWVSRVSSNRKDNKKESPLRQSPRASECRPAGQKQQDTPDHAQLDPQAEPLVVRAVSHVLRPIGLTVRVGAAHQAPAPSGPHAEQVRLPGHPGRGAQAVAGRRIAPGCSRRPCACRPTTGPN